MNNEVRANQSATIGEAFTLFYGNRAGRSPNDNETWLISHLSDSLGEDDIHMPAWAQQMLPAKYEDQTQCLNQYAAAGVDDLATKSKVMTNDLEPRSCLEDVFSVTTARFIERAATKRVISEVPADNSGKEPT